MLIVIKVDLTQVPGMCKLLSTPVKHPRTAQVPAWRGDEWVAVNEGARLESLSNSTNFDSTWS